MRRFLVTTALVAAGVLGGSSGAQAQQLLNLELSAGAGVSAFNVSTDSALAPPFVQLQLSWLPLRAGPLAMGPVAGVPLGFYQPQGQEDWRAQVGLRLGWQVYGRPSVDFAWSALAAANLVFSPLNETSDMFDVVWGLEVGGSGAYFLTAGFALTAGLGYAFFYGVDPVHVFSGQLGVLISYEVIQ